VIQLVKGLCLGNEMINFLWGNSHRRGWLKGRALKTKEQRRRKRKRRKDSSERLYQDESKKRLKKKKKLIVLSNALHTQIPNTTMAMASIFFRFPYVFGY
jgi:hypothetical protein